MREMIVDVFAGGGGASLGIQMALGVSPDLAINHDPDALAMHAFNHPDTEHGCADVWTVDPRKATKGRPVGLAWFSPDCTHFSRAKGGQPVQKKIRSLAWVVVKWAKAVRPRIIILENVPEFREWGPLKRRRVRTDKRYDDGTKKGKWAYYPDPDKKGMTWNLWCNQLRGLGYKLESRTLRACDYGAPTIRKRLFVIARCDGQSIVWPEPTHGETGGLFPLKPYRTAAECIDWTRPCPSIFLSREEAKKLNVRRPLSEKTLRRIALGINRFVLDNPKPFIVRCAHGEASASGNRWGQGSHSIDEPLPTITGSKDFALVAPTLQNLTHGGRSEPVESPLRTVTGANRGEKAVVAATLIQTGYGEREGQAPRVPGIDKPLGTVVGTGKHALMAACLTKYHGLKGNEARGQEMTDPAQTVDTSNRFALVGAFLQKYFSGVVGSDLRSPTPTVTAIDHNALVAAHLTKLYGTAVGSDAREPMPTVTGGGQHIGQVQAFLLKYYATTVGQSCKEPMHTVTSKDRLGLVTVLGEPYLIADIGLRMLTPRELARAQGFPDTYKLTGTKTNQVSKIGNSVCPPLAAALVKANVQLREVELRADGVA